MRQRQKVGRNDPCPCGSGLKFKRCCLVKGGGLTGTGTGTRTETRAHFTQQDRLSALAALERYAERYLEEEKGQAFWEFWRDADEEEIEAFEALEPTWQEVSDEVFDMWFWFDRPLADGRLVVDRFLKKEAARLSAGERRVLEMLRGTCMRVYEVQDARPGLSMTLQEVSDGESVTVREQSASRGAVLGELVALRIVPCGISGEPEIEVGALVLPQFFRDQLVSDLDSFRAEFRQKKPDAGKKAFFAEFLPFIHWVWAAGVIEPPIPQTQDTEGEDFLITRAHFDVLDTDALTRALDTAGGGLERQEGMSEIFRRQEDRSGDFERQAQDKSRDAERRDAESRDAECQDGQSGDAECQDGESDALKPQRSPTAWTWSGPNQRGEPAVLGRFELDGAKLMVETNSAERGARARALLESLAGEAVKHRATTHEDLTQSLREQLAAAKRTSEAGEKRQLPPAENAP